MTKSISPDVAAFKDDVFKGLTLRECIYGGAAIGVGVGGMLFFCFYCHLPINFSVTICIPVIGAIGLCGFYHKDDLTLPQIIREMVRIARQKPFTYETTTWDGTINKDCKNDKKKILRKKQAI